MLAPRPGCFSPNLVALHHRPKGFRQGREVRVQGLHVLFQLGHLHEVGAQGKHLQASRVPIRSWWEGGRAISLTCAHATCRELCTWLFVLGEGELPAAFGKRH